MGTMSKEQIKDTIEIFARKYVETLNQGEAYREAHPGVEESTAGPAAHRFIRRPDVRARVQELFDARAKKLEISAEKVLQEIAALAFSNPHDYVLIQEDGSPVIDLTGLSRQQFAAIQEILVDEYVEGKGDAARDVKRIKVKFYDKGQNLERLGRHLKLFSDTVEVKGLEALVERIRKARERTRSEDDHSDLA